jgi:hypothetical protein
MACLKGGDQKQNADSLVKLYAKLYAFLAINMQKYA